MLSHVFILLSVVALLRSSSGAAPPTNCTAPPVMWCDSPETAQLCGVKAQCDAYNTTRQHKKLKLSLFYETLCPDCQRFLTGTLFPVIWQQLGDIVEEIELVPYGNAQESQVGGRWQFDCQHGVNECELNLIHTCILHYLANATNKGASLEFINCMELKAMGLVDPAEALSQCGDQLGMSKQTRDKVMHCKASDLGNQLEHQMALKSEGVWPAKYDHVPWIVVNDVSTVGVNMLPDDAWPAIICNAYRGDALPAACQNLQMTKLVSKRKFRKLLLQALREHDKKALERIYAKNGGVTATEK